MAIIDKIQLSGTVYTIGNETTTAVTSASTDNEIPTAKAVYDAIPQGGGGKAVSGGTNISITTGETADTINCTLPISASTNGNGIILDTNSTASNGAIASGYKANAAPNSIVFGYSSSTSSEDSIAVGQNNKINIAGNSRFALGEKNIVSTYGRGALGRCLISKAYGEVACGQYNISRGNDFFFGNSGDTLFTVGNGAYSDSTRHNAFEIRGNGDIYIADTNDTSTANYYEKPMIKLQDALGGGGGSSYTAGDGIDITNDVISVTGKADTSAVTEIQDSLSGYVYTADNGKQDIFGSKIFIGNKKISFTQAKSNDKLGFTLYDTRDEQGKAKEFGAFELNPTGITENNVTHPLLTLNHYRNNSGRDVQTYIGYRQYDYQHSAAYHLLAPLPENAKAPFSLTTNFKNFYMPLGIKVDNSTMVKADSGGVMDISSYISGGSITIDQSLDSGSTNAVANSAISAALNYSNKFLYSVTAKKTWDNHPTGVIQQRWINPYNGSTNTTQDIVTLMKINNIPLIADPVSRIYNLNLVETSAITTSITSSSTDVQVPSAKAVNDQLGGLKLVKLSQSEYDALATKDSNVLYVIVG